MTLPQKQGRRLPHRLAALAQGSLRITLLKSVRCGSVAALVHAADEVVPGEAVFVEEGPEEAYAEEEGGERECGHSAAEGGAGGVLVGEGAKADAGDAHAGSGVGEGEEEGLVGEAEGDGCAGEGSETDGQGQAVQGCGGSGEEAVGVPGAGGGVAGYGGECGGEH